MTLTQMTGHTTHKDMNTLTMSNISTRNWTIDISVEVNTQLHTHAVTPCMLTTMYIVYHLPLNYPPLCERLTRQVLQLEGSVAAIMSRIELIMGKLELKETTKGKETIGKLCVTNNDVSMDMDFCYYSPIKKRLRE